MQIKLFLFGDLSKSWRLIKSLVCSFFYGAFYGRQFMQQRSPPNQGLSCRLHCLDDMWIVEYVVVSKSA